MKQEALDFRFYSQVFKESMGERLGGTCLGSNFTDGVVTDGSVKQYQKARLLFVFQSSG